MVFGGRSPLIREDIHPAVQKGCFVLFGENGVIVLFLIIFLDFPNSGQSYSIGALSVLAGATAAKDTLFVRAKWSIFQFI